MQEFIPYDTAAATKEREFYPGDVGKALILDIASDYSGSDTIPVYYVGIDGERLTPALDQDGNDFEFSSTNKTFPIYFSCRIRVVKGATTQAMGINQSGLK